MDEYIEREDALSILRKNWRSMSDANDAIQQSICDIGKLPAADVRPVVRGQWDADGLCSACGNRWNEYLHDGADDWGYFDPMPPFCLNCGADMRENLQ